MTPSSDEKKENAVVFSIRFSPSELDGIRRQADAMGVTVASIIRNAVVDYSLNQTLVLNFASSERPMVTFMDANLVPNNLVYNWGDISAMPLDCMLECKNIVKAPIASAGPRLDERRPHIVLQ